jgi:hypothetical protein
MKLSWVLLLFIAGACTLAFAQSNPVPFVNQPLVPMTVVPGNPGFTLTVNGTGFVPGSVVNWNGSPLATTFVGSSQLAATVPAVNVAKPATASVTVVSPIPGGGTSNVAFVQVSVPVVPNFASFPYSFGLQNEFISRPVTGDFNRDGKLDILTIVDSTNPDFSGLVGGYALLLGNGDGTFEVQGSMPGFIESWAVGDFNGDGKLDLFLDVHQYQQPGVFVTMLGNDDGTFQNPITATSFTQDASEILMGDFNGDGKLDVALDSSLGNGHGPSFTVLLGNGDGTFQQMQTVALNEETLCGMVGDFNRDGKLDLLACSNNNVGIAVLLGNGDGTFQIPTSLTPLTFGPIDVEVADVNGDGKLDLVAVQDASAGSIAVLLGNGDGTFQPALTYPAGVNPTQAIIGDFNADGKLDLALPASISLYILSGNGDGTFGSPESFAISAGLGAVGDFNQDGIPDLAVQGSPPGSQNLTLQILLRYVPKADFSPLNLAFGSLPVRTLSSPEQVTLSNDGAAPLAISSIKIAGDFAETNTCGSSVPSNGNCKISVTFKPTAAGVRQNFLTVNDNAPGSPQKLTLTGTAMDFVLTGTPPTSMTVTPGQAANYSISVSPESGFNQAVALACSGAPPQSTCMITPSSVTLDGSHAAPVTIAVVTAGSSAALNPPLGGSRGHLLLALAMLGGVFGFLAMPGTVQAQRRRRTQFLGGLFMFSLVSVVLMMPACGGGSNGVGSSGGGGTPTGTYSVTVAGTFGTGSAKLTHGTSFTLVVQ